MKEKILILEDEIGIRSFVSINLKREGYEVIEAGCGQEAIDKIKNEKNISLALLDVMLPDMRLPIQYALNYPKREERIANPISFYEIAQLTFEKPDMDTFKCLKLAFKAGKTGGLMPTILNGANEEAVALLLEEKIKFLDIADLIEECMNKFKEKSNMELTIDNIITVDKEVREYLRKKVS